METVIIKCSGCKKPLTTETTSRCNLCLEKKRQKTIPSSNIVWNRYPELKKISDDYKLHPHLTLGSKVSINLICMRCKNASSLAVADLLQFPWCAYCLNSYITTNVNKTAFTQLVRRFILQTENYVQFGEKIKELSQVRQKGLAQELFAKYYFESHRKHYNLKAYYSREFDTSRLFVAFRALADKSDDRTSRKSALISLFCLILYHSKARNHHKQTTSTHTSPLMATHNNNASTTSTTSIDKTVSPKTSTSDIPERKSSPQFDFYNLLFPVEIGTGKRIAMGKLVALSPDAVKKQYPERFNFSVINDNFVALAARLPKDLSKLWDNEVTVYQYDKLKYRAERDVSHWDMADGTRVKQLSIRLSNDGFLYSPAKDLAVHRSGVSRHHSNTWSVLDHSEIARFHTIVDWCKSTAFGATKPKAVRFTMFYNFDDDRIDIKAVYPSSTLAWPTGVKPPIDREVDSHAVVITFEPGYPYEDFDDYWIDP